eukprot:3110950-Pyramimonas_sp.AAC.1
MALECVISLGYLGPHAQAPARLLLHAAIPPRAERGPAAALHCLLGRRSGVSFERHAVGARVRPVRALYQLRAPGHPERAGQCVCGRP